MTNTVLDMQQNFIYPKKTDVKNNPYKTVKNIAKLQEDNSAVV